MGAAAVRARVRADVRGRRRDGQPLVGERVLDADGERERVAGLRMKHVLHHDAVGLALARLDHADQRTSPWIAFRCSGSLSGSWWRARRTRRRRPRGGSATGAAPARGRTCTSRPPRSRRAARDRPRSTCAGRRRPRRRPPAGRRGRARTALRTAAHVYRGTGWREVTPPAMAARTTGSTSAPLRRGSCRIAALDG